MKRFWAFMAIIIKYGDLIKCVNNLRRRTLNLLAGIFVFISVDKALVPYLILGLASEFVHKDFGL